MKFKATIMISWLQQQYVAFDKPDSLSSNSHDFVLFVRTSTRESVGVYTCTYMRLHSLHVT